MQDPDLLGELGEVSGDAHFANAGSQRRPSAGGMGGAGGGRGGGRGGGVGTRMCGCKPELKNNHANIDLAMSGGTYYPHAHITHPHTYTH